MYALLGISHGHPQLVGNHKVLWNCHIGILKPRQGEFGGISCLDASEVETPSLRLRWKVSKYNSPTEFLRTYRRTDCALVDVMQRQSWLQTVQFYCSDAPYQNQP